MRFWLNKGIDGFRMDAFQYVAKDTTWPAFPPGYEKNIIKYYGIGPHMHDYLQEMNREVISKYDIMTVAEGAGSTTDDAMQFVDPSRNELNMAYHFEGMDIGNDLKGYSLIDFKNVYTKWDSAFAEKGWVSIFLANHDVPRMVSKFGNDKPPFREASSKLLTTFIMSMRGTPYYYYGDEIGMGNIRFNNIADYKDVETLNKYQQIKNQGGDLQAFIELKKLTARDNGRTPFQWNDQENAGFTTGTPWLKINPDYKKVNAAAQEKDPNSVLNYFRKMIKLRKQLAELVYGSYKLLDRENPNVYAYTRSLGNKKVLVLLNFSTASSTFNLPPGNGKTAEAFINNKSTLAIKKKGDNTSFVLQPYQAVVLRLN